MKRILIALLLLAVVVTAEQRARKRPFWVEGNKQRYVPSYGTRTTVYTPSSATSYYTSYQAPVYSQTPKAMQLSDHYGEFPSPLMTRQKKALQAEARRLWSSGALCSVYSSRPYECIAQSQCGWCAATRSCISGTMTGPAYISACPTVAYYFEKPVGRWNPYTVHIQQGATARFSVPVVHHYRDCSALTAYPTACVKSDLCGWCGATATCVPGTPSNPLRVSYCAKPSTYTFTVAKPSTWDPYYYIQIQA